MVDAARASRPVLFPRGGDAVGDYARPGAVIDAIPTRLHMAPNRFEQGNVEQMVAHGLTVVAGHNPKVVLPFDEQLLAAWTVPAPCRCPRSSGYCGAISLSEMR